MNRNEIEICEFKMHLKNFFCLRSNLSNDDIISAYRQGLKMGVEMTFFGHQSRKYSMHSPQKVTKGKTNNLKEIVIPAYTVLNYKVP